MNNPPSPTSTERKALAEWLRSLPEKTLLRGVHMKASERDALVSALDRIPDPVGPDLRKALNVCRGALDACLTVHPDNRGIKAAIKLAEDALATPQSAGVSENDGEEKNRHKEPTDPIEASATECAVWTKREALSIWTYQLECQPKYICPNADDGKHFDVYGDLSCLIANESGWACLVCDHKSFEVSDEARNYRADELEWIEHCVPVESLTMEGILAEQKAPAFSPSSDPFDNAETRRNDSGECPPPVKLTLAQFMLQMNLAYARVYPGTRAKVTIPSAATIMKEFLADEKIEFGDPRYAWDASAAETLVREYEGVDAETDAVAPGDTNLVSGAASDPIPSPVSEAEVIERAAVIEECAKVADFAAAEMNATGSFHKAGTISRDRCDARVREATKIASAIRALSTPIGK